MYLQFNALHSLQSVHKILRIAFLDLTTGSGPSSHSALCTKKPIFKGIYKEEYEGRNPHNLMIVVGNAVTSQPIQGDPIGFQGDRH